MEPRPIGYWTWFFRRGEHAGWKKLVDWWLLLHVLVGLVLSYFITMPLGEAAKAVLLPLTGVLVGMSFAWVGNALAIASTSEIDHLADKNPAGFEVYVHTFQTAILVLLTCLVAWGLAGLGAFDLPCFWPCPQWSHGFARFMLYGLSSFAVRECWHVVLGAQLLLLYQRAIRRVNQKAGDGESTKG